MIRKSKQIFVFRLGPIGDVVNVVPLIKYLKAVHKDVEIIYVCESLYFPLVSRIKEIDKIHICEIERDLQSLESINKMADDLINLYGASAASEFIILHLNEYFTNLAKSIGVTKIYKYRNRDFWFSNLNLWKRFISTYDAKINFTDFNENKFLPLFEIKKLQAIEEKLQKRKIDLNRNFIALVPGVGANLPHKAWPKNCWVNLIKLIVQKNELNAEICLIGSEKEKKLIHEILNELNSENIVSNNIHDLSGDFELDELVDLFSLFKICIGSDSGAVHIASGMGVFTVCLFGPTSPVKHRPIKASIIDAKCSIFCKPFKKKCIFGAKNSCIGKITPLKVFEAIYPSI